MTSRVADRPSESHPDDSGSDVACARDYVDALGLGSATEFSTWSFRQAHWNRPGGSYQWRHHHVAPFASLFSAALAGQYGLAVSGLSETAVIVLDVDVHDPVTVPPVPTQTTLQEAIEAVRARDDQVAEARRERIAKTMRAVIARLASAHPKAEWLVSSTPRGGRVFCLLKRSVPIAEAATIADRVWRSIGSPRNVEAFPSVDGRLPRLPSTGPMSRLLGDDCRTPRHRLRRDDLRDIVTAKRVAPSVLARGRFGEIPCETKGPFVEESQSLPRLSKDKKKRGKKRPPRAVPEHVQGEDFSDVIASYAQHGIPLGESWEAIRKVTFALRVSAGMRQSDCLTIIAKWIDEHKHTANHCTTRSGRAELMSTARSCLRYYGSGIRAGRLKPGLAKSKRLLSAIAVIAGQTTVIAPRSAKSKREKFRRLTDEEIATKAQTKKNRRECQQRRQAREIEKRETEIANQESGRTDSSEVSRDQDTRRFPPTDRRRDQGEGNREGKSTRSPKTASRSREERPNATTATTDATANATPSATTTNPNTATNATATPTDTETPRRGCRSDASSPTERSCPPHRAKASSETATGPPKTETHKNAKTPRPTKESGDIVASWPTSSSGEGGEPGFSSLGLITRCDHESSSTGPPPNHNPPRNPKNRISVSSTPIESVTSATRSTPTSTRTT